MKTRCERRGQVEIGIVTHDGHEFAAFGASINGRTITAYLSHDRGHLALKSWCGRVMLVCRHEVVREFHDGSLAVMFRLTKGRFIVGYALGEEGMLFRGELLTDCDDEQARHEALSLADYWSDIDVEDEADPWHGEPDEDDSGNW